jgi:hypothetical protein
MVFPAAVGTFDNSKSILFLALHYLGDIVSFYGSGLRSLHLGFLSEQSSTRHQLWSYGRPGNYPRFRGGHFSQVFIDPFVSG